MHPSLQTPSPAPPPILKRSSAPIPILAFPLPHLNHTRNPSGTTLSSTPLHAPSGPPPPFPPPPAPALQLARPRPSKLPVDLLVVPTPSLLSTLERWLLEASRARRRRMVARGASRGTSRKIGSLQVVQLELRPLKMRRPRRKALLRRRRAARASSCSLPSLDHLQNDVRTRRCAPCWASTTRKSWKRVKGRVR
jgi:hypothetical protein